MTWRILGILVCSSALAFADPYPLEQSPHAVTSAQVSCTNASGGVVAVAGGARHGFTIINTTANVAYICFATTCSTTTGYPLNQNVALENHNYTGVVSCVVASTSTTLGVLVY